MTSTMRAMLGFEPEIMREGEEGSPEPGNETHVSQHRSAWPMQKLNHLPTITEHNAIHTCTARLYIHPDQNLPSVTPSPF